MKTTNQLPVFCIKLGFYFISVFFMLFVLSANAQTTYGKSGSLTIVKMFKGQQPSASAVLTINEPCGNTMSQNCGKPLKGTYALNHNRQFNSGTTFMTHEDYTIFVRSNGAISKIQPNSSNMIKSNNGNEVHNPKGLVGMLAEKSRDLSKSIIVNGHNVSAKMKTTEFWVDTRGAQTTFSPVEGTISILEKVPVTIGSEKFKSQSEDRERGRTGTYPVRTERSGGQPNYTTGQQQSRNYNSLSDAINKINAYINKFSDTMYPEELAETYVLLGQFYLDAEAYEYALTCFENSANIYTAVNPTGLEALEAELYLAEAQIYSNDADGYNAVAETIEELKSDLQYYYGEYVYAGQIEEYDIQTDFCYQLVDTNDLLGWAYDLLDNEVEADKYYGWAASYPCQD